MVGWFLLHVWPHLQLLFLSFIPLQTHWPPSCSAKCHGNMPQGLYTCVPFVVITRPPDICIACSLSLLHPFLFKCPQWDLPRPVWYHKLPVWYHSIFYHPTMRSFPSLTHIPNFTHLAHCLPHPLPKTQTPNLGVFMYTAIYTVYTTPKVRAGAHIISGY